MSALTWAFLIESWPVLLAPALAVVLALGLIGPARRYGCLDHPGGRKRHDAPTPLVGGLAIFLTILLVSAAFGALPGGSASLTVAMTLAVLFGLADDLRQFGHRAKFFGQLVAALIVVSGTTVHVLYFGDLLGIGAIELGKWAYLVTVISLIGLMNAVNMIDGLDGLAGSLVAVPLCLFAAVALMAGEWRLGLEILAVLGAVAGFLALNLRLPGRARARVFMGEAGGVLLGLLLGWYAIKLAGDGVGPIRPITAVWIVALPLLDMGSVMALRIARGKSPFHADRWHLHHVLHDAGCPVGRVVAIMVGLSLLLGLTGLAAERVVVPEFVMFYAFLGLWALYFLVLARPESLRRLAARLAGQRHD